MYWQRTTEQVSRPTYDEFELQIWLKKLVRMPGVIMCEENFIHDACKLNASPSSEKLLETGSKILLRFIVILQNSWILLYSREVK